MPQGLSRIQVLSEQAAAKSAEFQSGASNDSVRALKMAPGETATGRFLEEGQHVWFLYMHDLPLKPGQRYADRVQCLDQDDALLPCPGCTAQAKRTARMVINFVRYDEPKLVRGEDGKGVKDASGAYQFDGVEPALVLWEAPQSAGGRLGYLEMQNNGGDPAHGISHHVVTIARTYDNKNPWMIDVVKRDEPVADFEKEFFSKKISPPQAITSVFPRFLSRPIMSVNDMARAYGVASGFAQPAPQPGGNMYANAAQSGGVTPGAFS
jgi:hypothetical protein